MCVCVCVCVCRVLPSDWLPVYCSLSALTAAEGRMKTQRTTLHLLLSPASLLCTDSRSVIFYWIVWTCFEELNHNLDVFLVSFEDVQTPDIRCSRCASERALSPSLPFLIVSCRLRPSSGLPHDWLSEICSARSSLDDRRVTWCCCWITDAVLMSGWMWWSVKKVDTLVSQEKGNQKDRSRLLVCPRQLKLTRHEHTEVQRAEGLKLLYHCWVNLLWQTRRSGHE